MFGSKAETDRANKSEIEQSSELSMEQLTAFIDFQLATTTAEAAMMDAVLALENDNPLRAKLLLKGALVEILATLKKHGYARP